MEPKLFIALAVVALLEVFLSHTWNPTYFRYGLPVFWRKHKLTPVRNWPSPAELANEVRARYSHLIVFRQTGRHEYAFREKAFQLTLASLAPVMHGRLNWEPRAGSMTVVGYANWFVVSVIVVAVYLLGQGNLRLLALLALIPALLYAIQARRFNRVATVAKERWTNR